MMTFDAIPPSLRAIPQWILYRLVRGDERTEKVPIDPRTGRACDAHDPASWMTFEQAVASMTSHVSGIGFVFADGDPFAGIDLDHCISPDGTMEPWAEQIIDCFGSYAEVSPGGDGIHIFIRGVFPEGFKHVTNGQGPEGHGKIEVYSTKRFFTVTGRQVGQISEVFDRQEEFTAFCLARLDRVAPTTREGPEAPPNNLSDEKVLENARKIWPVDRFRRLFDDGDLAAYEGDQNRADMALCNFLFFWTGKDALAIDRLFRRSRLMRDKWDSRRGDTTYGGYTIAKVIRTGGDHYHEAFEKQKKTTGGGDGKKDSDDFPLVVRASTIEPEAVEWLWPDRVPRGFISIFAGRTGIGKSFVTLDIVARVTTGAEWPDLEGECAPVGNVLILSEDPQKQVLVPRLIAMGADLEKVYFMTWKAMSEYTLSDTETLGKAAGMSGDPILIIIDPPTNFMGVIDEHRNVEVRAVLMHLVAWLESHPSPVAMILITHVSKSTKGVDAIARVIGSIAWVSTSRIAHVFASDPDHPGRALFLESKNNLGPLAQGLAYRVAKTETFARVEWLGKVTTSADDAMSGEKQKATKPDAVAWITERFREQRSWPKDDLKAAALDAGYSVNAVFKNPSIAALPIAKTHVYPTTGSSYWVWKAQEGWPLQNTSESSESSESYSASDCHVTENQTFGGDHIGPESYQETATPESYSDPPLELSGGVTFGLESGRPESLDNPDPPRVYGVTFGTFGTFGSPPAHAGACDPPLLPPPLQERERERERQDGGGGGIEYMDDTTRGCFDPPDSNRTVEAARFLSRMLRGSAELSHGYLLEWAEKIGITDPELIDAARFLKITRTLVPEDGGELWSFKMYE